MRVVAGLDNQRVKRVLLDGREVTKDCLEADDEEGWVRLVWRKTNGQAAAAFGNLLTRTKRGGVVIELNDE